MRTRKRLVVIGNGMAGARLVEDVIARDAGAFDITMFGDEPYGNYNRILLSGVLAGTPRSEGHLHQPAGVVRTRQRPAARRRAASPASTAPSAGSSAVTDGRTLR